MSQDWDAESIDLDVTTPAGLGTIVKNALLALKSKFSGASLPTTNLYGGMEVVLTSGARYFRNAGNDAWVAKGNINRQQYGIADIASAASIDLTGYETGSIATITGITPTSEILMNDGQVMTLVAAAAWVLTYHATTNKVVGAANYTCKAGELITVYKTGGVIYSIPANFASGQGQTWQDVTASRALNTTYTNTTGRTITVKLWSTPSSYFAESVNGIAGEGAGGYSLTYTVPDGGSYGQVSNQGAPFTFAVWKELR